MNFDIPFSKGKLLLLAAIPLMGTSCSQKQKQASAAVPPAANPASYPESQAPPSPSESPSLQQASAPKVEKPTPKPKPKAPPAPKYKPFVLRDGETLVSHKVVSGDTLGKLATTYGTDVSRIQSANGLSGTKILAGKTYKIPTKKDSFSASSDTVAASSPPPPPAAPKPPVDRSYTPPPPVVTSAGSDQPFAAPRDIQYSGPTISNTPSLPKIGAPGGTSITIPSSQSSDSGSAFPTPNFGAGSSF